ncbi:hypothetical protein ACWEP4_43000 [Streptomyces sp. NPDC004227]
MEPTADTQQSTPEALHAAADLAAAVDAIYHGPTRYKDDTKPPAIGTTPPVPQPDTRRVPAWATGLAVGSIGVGAGSTGLGCAAWLAFKGLSLVSLPSLQTFVLIVLAPFVGVALAAVAIGAAIAKTKRASTTNVYKGSVTVTQKTEVNSTARGLFARNRNAIKG